MNIEELRIYCLSIKGSVESMPFPKHNILGFKVMDKIFAYIYLEPKDGIFRVNLKCDPERTPDLREKYLGISETDFKTLSWNLVAIEKDIPNDIIKELISHSVEEVIKKLPKAKKAEYANL